MASIGVTLIGKVDEINKESIQTLFFVLGMPLFPIESYYCLGKPPHSNFLIPLHPKSVVLGYLRWWISIVSLTVIFIAFAAEKYILFVPGIIGIALFLSTFWLGRLSKKEKQRRQILINLTGLGADPGMLPKEMVKETINRLEEEWRQANKGTLRENWRSVASLNSTEKSLYPLLYCLALYAGEKQIAERSWKNIEALA